MTMIQIKDLEGVKLVHDASYFASVEFTQLKLEQTFVQASQGWGVRQDDAVILRLAGDLRIALSGAADADGAMRLLKGAQLELGRVKKQKHGLEQTLVGNKTDIEGLRTQLDMSKRLVDALEKRVSYLESEGADLQGG